MIHPLKRIRFMLEYKTLKRIAISPKDNQKIAVFHNGKVTTLNRACPHQKAPMEEGYISAGALFCPWHGCRFELR